MTRLSKFLIVWWGVVLVLAACGTVETDSTAEGMENAAGNEKTAVSPTAKPRQANYPNLGSAPEIENEVWLNADQPVTLASQRGKVVLVEFWTYG